MYVCAMYMANHLLESPESELFEINKVLDLYMKTTWGNLTHDNNDGDDDTSILIACFNAIIVAC